MEQKIQKLIDKYEGKIFDLKVNLPGQTDQVKWALKKQISTLQMAVRDLRCLLSVE